MIFLKALFVVVEVLCCLLLTVLILLQRAKNEGLGLAFGAGAGEALFGARAGNVLSRATVVLGVVFLANTLLLGVLFAHRSQSLIQQGIEASASAPQAAVQAPPDESLPAVPESMPPAETPAAPATEAPASGPAAQPQGM